MINSNMPQDSIFERLKSNNGTMFSYYARPKTFTSGGVSTTKSEWLTAFKDFGVKNIEEVYMEGGLEPTTFENHSIPIRHIFKHRVFAFPTQFHLLREPNSVFYLHEGWTLSNIVLAFFCCITKSPYIVMPHGVYDPNIVKKIKLRFLRKIGEKFVLTNALFVHVFFKIEINHIRQISRRASILVAPTGVNPAKFKRFGWRGDGDYFLYAGRLDPYMKGLDLLLKAYKESGVSQKLILAGPDYNGGRKELEKLILQLGIIDSVVFVGNLEQIELLQFVRGCKGFLHISRWESFGRSAVDALSVGSPTLISDQMNLSHCSYITDFCFVTNLSIRNIALKIRQIAALNREEFAESIRLKQDIFFREYSWTNSVQKLTNSADE